MLTLHFSQNKKKQSLRTRLQEKWMSMSGGKPKIQSWQLIGIAITAILTYLPAKTLNFTWKNILPTLAYPIFVYLASMVVLIIMIQAQTRYIPEDFYLRWKQSVFWYSIFIACVTLPVIILFLVRTFLT